MNKQKGNFWNREIESKARQDVPTSYELVTKLIETIINKSK